MSSTSPAPSGAILEQTIVDRPGVPAALYDKYWILGGQVGRVGTTARIVMPPNEAVMGADAGRVAAYIQDPNIYEPVVGPNGVTIVVRDFVTGKVVRTFDTQVRVSESLMTGPLLFWIGQMLPVDGPDRIDAGIWVIDLSDPASVPRTVIAPANLDAAYGQRAIRGLLRLTDRGRAITTQIESDTRLVTDVIDVASLSLRATIDADREWAFEVVDGVALVILPHEYTSGDRPGEIRLIDIATGRQIGPAVPADLLAGSVVGEHEVFAAIGRGRDSYTIAIALDSGKSRNLRVVLGGKETLDLSPQLSAPDLLTFVPDTGAPPDLNDQGKVVLPVTLLDPATGEIIPDAFTIGAP